MANFQIFLPKKQLFLIVLAFGLSESFSQERTIPVRIVILNESTAIPYTRFLTTPIHPGIQAGTEFEYKNSARHYLYQTANVGYIFHNHLYQGVYVNSEIGYDYKFPFGLTAKALFGLGYLHTFSTQQEYRFDNGDYSSRADRGNARLLPSLTIGCGYRFNPADVHSPEAFLLYQSWVEYPYSPGFIPVMTHISLQLGIKFYLQLNGIKADEK